MSGRFINIASDSHDATTRTLTPELTLKVVSSRSGDDDFWWCLAGWLQQLFRTLVYGPLPPGSKRQNATIDTTARAVS